MDYESRKVKWYWLLLFMVYCGGVVDFLFQGNPFLYSRNELRSALDVGDSAHRKTIPQHPAPGKLTQPTAQARYGPQRTGLDPMSGPRSKNYAEYERLPVETGIEGFAVQTLAQDASGFYVTGKGPWAVAIGLDGKVRWKFRFPEKTPARFLPPVLLDETYAYLVHASGEVVCLDKLTGEIRWVQYLKDEVVAAPLLWKGNVVVPTNDSGSVQLTLVNRLTGQVAEDSPHLEIKPGFQVSECPELNLLIFTVDNKVVAVENQDWQVEWTQTLTDPIRGPAVTVGTQIFVATLGAKVVKLDGSKKGKIDWEADIVKPAANPPSYIPILNRLSVMDVSGAISTIDMKTGKIFWRYATEDRGPWFETWSARVKGQHIEEFHMDWLHKGWTIWAPCAESAFCIYTPNKGELVNRIPLGGRPLGLPLNIDRKWVFLTQNKAGHYLISDTMEESEIKKLKSEAPRAKAE